MLYIVLQVKPYTMDKESGILRVAVLCFTHHNLLGVLITISVCSLSGQLQCMHSKGLFSTELVQTTVYTLPVANRGGWTEIINVSCACKNE